MDLRHPPAEVAVDVGLARRLLRSQHPDLLVGDLALIGEGWDNFTFRVGTGHALRIPRREVAVELLRNEQRWLPEVAADLGLEVPMPVASGRPSVLFGWPWSVVRWVEGTTAEGVTLGVGDAEILAVALRSLHRPSPSGAPTNPYRGVPLVERKDVIQERLGRLRLGQLLPILDAALDVSSHEDAVWLHGDLHPRNVVLRDGRLVGLIDWGDMTGGDRATDLASAWTLFGSDGREAFRRVYAPTEDAWVRARGWALHFGSALLDSGDDAHAAMGRRILEQLGR